MSYSNSLVTVTGNYHDVRELLATAATGRASSCSLPPPVCLSFCPLCRYIYIVSPFPAQARFIMAAQARLAQLGAYRGDRRAGTAKDLDEYNYLSDVGRVSAALQL